MKTANPLQNDVLLYEPCHTLRFDAPFRWLKKGWQDFQSAPWHSLTYGAIFAGVALMLVYFSWSDSSYLLLGLPLSLLIVGPVLAFGLYDISQQLELKRKPTFGHERMKAFHEMGHELMLALLLSIAFLIMLIMISLVTNIGTTLGQLAVSAAVPVSGVVSLLIFAVFAGLFFCAGTFGLPMILDRDANAMTAMITSLHAVWRNKSVLTLWVLMILALTAVGFATALIGFVLIAPVLGYATWHAYRETIIKE